MRIDRMLGIVVLLLNRNRITAKELSERFEVSIRTIYRDIESICLAGIPIVSQPGSRGGLGIMENYRLSGQILSIDDMTSIISTLKNVNSTLGSRELESVSEKILTLIPKDRIDNLKKQSEELFFDLMPWSFQEKTRDFIKLIQYAISDRLLIRFFYRNNRGEAMKRTVEPMTLVFKGYAWYLFAWCRSRGDYRLFKLSRMDIIEILPEKFGRRKDTYSDIMKQPAQAAGLINIVLKFSPEARLKVEEYFGENITSVLDDGSLIVSMRLPEDEWIYSIILGFGEQAEVLEPLHVRKIIIEKIKKISSIYNTDMMLSQ